jgi:hypothetical protein
LCVNSRIPTSSAPVMEGSFAGIAGRSTFAVVSNVNVQQLLPQSTSGPLQQSPAEDQELRSCFRPSLCLIQLLIQQHPFKLRWWFLFPARRQATWWHPSCLYRQLAQRCLRLLSQSVRPFSPAPGKHASLESGRHAHARVRGWLPRTGGVFRTAQPGRRQVIRLQRSIPPS